MARSLRARACLLMTALLLVACGSTPIGSPSTGLPNASGTPAEAPAVSPGGTATPPAAPTPAPTKGITLVTATMASFRLPAPLSRAVAFEDGTGLLVCGGLTGTGTTASVVRIDPAGGTVTHVADLGVAVHDAAGAAFGGSMIVFGGGQAIAEPTVQRVATTGPGAVIGRLPIARADAAAVTVGNQLVLLGGGLNGVVDRAVLATSDGIHFTAIATLPVGVRYATAAALGGTIYLFGGAGPAGDVATIQAVDVAAGTARRVAVLPETLSHAMAFVIDDRIYVAGGRHAARALDTILEFDPASGRTTVVGRLPQAMSDAATAVVRGTAYVVGGEANGLLDSIVALVPG